MPLANLDTEIKITLNRTELRDFERAGETLSAEWRYPISALLRKRASLKDRLAKNPPRFTGKKRRMEYAITLLEWVIRSATGQRVEEFEAMVVEENGDGNGA